MKLTPQTPVAALENTTVGDFWSWAYSDIRSNRNRGIFAEFLVGTALGAVDQPRIEWDGYDLLYRDRRIEVKASGYVQSWNQTRPSTISFNIAPRLAWDSQTNTYALVPARANDCYVFCLHAEQERDAAQVLKVEQWKFYVVPTSTLLAQFGNQKTIRLGPLTTRCNVTPIDFTQLKNAVDRVLDSLE